MIKTFLLHLVLFGYFIFLQTLRTYSALTCEHYGAHNSNMIRRFAVFWLSVPVRAYTHNFSYFLPKNGKLLWFILKYLVNSQFIMHKTEFTGTHKPNLYELKIELNSPSHPKRRWRWWTGNKMNDNISAQKKSDIIIFIYFLRRFRFIHCWLQKRLFACYWANMTKSMNFFLCCSIQSHFTLCACCPVCSFHR